MPSEPIEAEFIRPPALSPEQEEEFRNLELENLGSQLSRQVTQGSTTHAGSPSVNTANIHELEQVLTKEGYQIIGFDKGTGEDPREWSNGKKWSVVAFSLVLGTDLRLSSTRYVTVATATLCLSVAIGSSIVTGEYVLSSYNLFRAGD
jgi:hypothetical protein